MLRLSRLSGVSTRLERLRRYFFHRTTMNISPREIHTSFSTLPELTKQLEEEALATLNLKLEYEARAKKLYELDARLKALRNQASSTSSQDNFVGSHESSTAEHVSIDVISSDRDVGIRDDGDLVDRDRAVKAVINVGRQYAQEEPLRYRDDGHLLNHVTIVLTRISGAVNLGQICRFAANMGVTDIRLVAPACPVNCTDSRRFANHARPLLDTLPQYDTVSNAVADCAAVIVTSGVVKSFKGCDVVGPAAIADRCRQWGIWDVPRASSQDSSLDSAETVSSTHASISTFSSTSTSTCTSLRSSSTLDTEGEADDSKATAAQATSSTSSASAALAATREALESLSPRVAIVFGPEADGLSSEDMQLARLSINIPTRGSYTSLNVGHAVVAVIYTVFNTGFPTASQVSKVANVEALTHPKQSFGDPQLSLRDAPEYKKGGGRHRDAGRPATVRQIQSLQKYFTATMKRWGHEVAVSNPEAFQYGLNVLTRKFSHITQYSTTTTIPAATSSSTPTATAMATLTSTATGADSCSVPLSTTSAAAPTTITDFRFTGVDVATLNWAYGILKLFNDQAPSHLPSLENQT